MAALANVIEWIIFMGLLTATAYVVVQALNDYSEAKTYFSKSFEYVSDSDIPSITLWMTAAKKIEYGKDFELQVENAATRSSGSFMTDFRRKWSGSKTKGFKQSYGTIDWTAKVSNVCSICGTKRFNKELLCYSSNPQ